MRKLPAGRVESALERVIGIPPLFSRRHILEGIGYSLLASTLAPRALGGVTVPPQAAAVGYDLNTFSSVFTPSRFSFHGPVSRRHPSRKDWYVFNFFGLGPDASILRFDRDGSLLITPKVHNANCHVSTAANNATGDWVGTAFGGGFFVEIEAKWNRRRMDRSPRNRATGWPALWSMAIEHLSPLVGEQWRGRPRGYKRFIEFDFMEDIFGRELEDEYVGNLHDWFGTDRSFRHIALGGHREYKNATGTHLNAALLDGAYVKFGALWVPATSRGNGYVKWFCNGVQVGARQHWIKHSPVETSPPVLNKNAFNVIDTQHMVIILGTGTSVPMNVRSVRVWQRSDEYNLIR